MLLEGACLLYIVFCYITNFVERTKRYAEQEAIDFSHPDSEYLLDFQDVVGVLPEDEQQPEWGQPSETGIVMSTDPSPTEDYWREQDF